MKDRPVLLLSPQVGTEISNSLQLSLGQSLDIKIELASSTESFLKYIQEDDNLIKSSKFRKFFCFVIKQKEIALLKKIQSEAREEQTVVVLDSKIQEIRVWDRRPKRINCIEISNIDALTTAVNLAYSEYQENLASMYAARKRSINFYQGKQYGSLPSPIVTPRKAELKRNSSASSISLSPSKNFQHARNQSFQNGSKMDQSSTPMKQQEINLLDLSDPVGPTTIDDLFYTPPIAFSPQKEEKNISRSELDFDSAFDIFAMNRQRKNSLSKNDQRQSNKQMALITSVNTSTLNNREQMNRSTTNNFANVNTNSYANGLRAMNRSSTIPAGNATHSTQDASIVKRQINYPRKSDIELMKVIQRNSKDLNSELEKAKHEKETFEINEITLLDFDFAFEEITPLPKEIRRSESYESLNRDFKVLLNKEGVDSILNPSKSIPTYQESPKPEKVITDESIPQKVKRTLSPEEKRARIIYEIYKEECNFVSSIETFQNIFIDPLKKNSLIPENLHRFAFSDFPVIFSIHNPMMESMKKLYGNIKPEDMNVVSDDFIQNFLAIIRNKAPAFKLYIRYFSQSNNILNSLKHEQQRNSAFKKFLDEAQQRLKSSDASRHTLTSYFQHILQHLARYPLTLQRLYDNTLPSSIYYKDLESLIEVIKGTLRHCNQRKTDADMEELVLSLEKEIGIPLQKRGRRLIKHGEIIRTKPTKKYAVQLYLFNDVIIMKDLRRTIGKRKKPKVLNVHHNLKVGQLSATSFFIFDCYYQKSEALTLFFEESNSDKSSEWVKVCSAVIKNWKKFKKNRESLSLDSSSEG